MSIPSLTQSEWRSLAALAQQAIELGRVSASDPQVAAAKKLIAWVEAESRPKKPRRGRWWLRR